MFDCILLSHGNLAEEILNTVHMIAGDIGEVKTFGLKQSQSVFEFQTEVEKYIENLDKEVIVFCDLLGGSPMISISNVISKSDKKIAIVTGMNLGMIIDCLLQREYQSFDEIINIAKKTGIEGIKTIVKEDLNASSIS